jgi:glycerol-3-phosphate O-acyltransferase
MRLDLNHDGHVSKEDLAKSVKELYEFLRNFEYINKATEIKNTLYNEAIKYMQRDLQNEERQQESHLEDSVQKDEISD